MTFRLSLNTGFAVNRYSEPEQWLKIVGRDLGVRYAQMTADMLNPSLSDAIIEHYIGRLRAASAEYDVAISNCFTGGFTRVNHLAHPNGEVQKYWVNWFKRFVDIAHAIGSTSIGSHFGIFTDADDRDQVRRRERRAQNIENWHEVGRYAVGKGMDYISWEPMSISREQGETIEACRLLQEDVNRNAPLPFKICLDVDHGDLSSPNPDDTDAYAWLRAFAAHSPLIHLKQSLKDKGGHYPFTAEYNANGKIEANRVMQTLVEHGNSDAELILEHSFRERQPADSTVVEVLKQSVGYWQHHLSA